MAGTVTPFVTLKCNYQVINVWITNILMTAD